MSVNTLVQHEYAEPRPLVLFERFLRDRQGVWLQIRQDRNLNALIKEMMLYAMGGLAAHGAVMGSTSGNLFQVLSSAIKLPILLLLTMSVCIPTFYLFNLMYGGRISIQQIFATILSCVTTMAVILAAFTPITLFFRFAAWDRPFFIFLSYALMAISILLGMKFMLAGLKDINAGFYGPISLEPYAPPEQEPGEQPLINMRLMGLFFGLSIFIGVELLWTLRPFFGDGGFELFSDRPSGIFTGKLIRTLLEVLFG